MTTTSPSVAYGGLHAATEQLTVVCRHAAPPRALVIAEIAPHASRQTAGRHRKPTLWDRFVRAEQARPIPPTPFDHIREVDAQRRGTAS